MKISTAILIILGFCSVGAFRFSYLESGASESAFSKSQDVATDAKTRTKKTIRKAKRKIRKVTGQDSVLKDTKDEFNDIGDDLSGSAEKAKRHKK